MSEHHESIDNLKALYPFRYKIPQIDKSVFLAEGSQVIGDVVIGKNSSVWFNSVIRGDVNYIRIGEGTNIQDLSMVHVSFKSFPTEIGNFVTVGHSVIIHACKIGNYSLIGMGSCVQDGAEIGDFVLLGAGSLVTQGMKIPSGSKAFGRPAKVVGQISEEEKAHIKWSAEHYVRLASSYR